MGVTATMTPERAAEVLALMADPWDHSLLDVQAAGLELYATVDRLAAENAGLRAAVRKADHGCYGHPCTVCDRRPDTF